MVFLDAPRFPTDINYKLIREIAYVNHLNQNQAGIEQVNAIMTQAKHRYEVIYQAKDLATMHKMINFFHAVRGRSHCFRFKDSVDYTSSSHPDLPITANDQVLSGVVNGQNTCFQLLKRYGVGNLRSLRYITKPVLTSLLVSIDGVIIDSAFYTVNSTGRLAFTHSNQGNIQAISNTHPAKITARNQLQAGQTIALSHMNGMPQLEGKRFVVRSATQASIILDLDTDHLGQYQGGGTFNSVPISGEQPCAGFEFDVPVRFDQDTLTLRVEADNVYSIDLLPLVEVFLP